MAKFEDAIDFVLKHEGGVSNDLDDAGGLTKWGICSRDYPQVFEDGFSLNDAKAIYRSKYWCYDSVRDQSVATKVFDMAVNMGPANAHRCLQKALNAKGDGVFGIITLGLTNQADPAKLLYELTVRAVIYYVTLAVAKPSQAKFLEGWIRRACDRP